MNNNLTNLLPQERQRALSRDYILRIVVVVVVLTTTLILAESVLLIPTYVFLNRSENAKKIHLAGIESTLSSADEAILSARLETLSSNVTSLASLSNVPSVSAVVRAMLGVSRPGVSLSGFSFTPPSSNNPGTLTISGSSATRNALRSYQLSLQGASFARSAVLPVSAYAKDTNIAFTITVTLSP